MLRSTLLAVPLMMLNASQLTAQEKSFVLIARTEGEGRGRINVSPTVTRGPAVYRTACASCHEQGGVGAPLRHDPEYWAKRLASIGRDKLNRHAIQGFVGRRGVMPAKGGRSDLSDADVIAAVDVLTARARGAR